MLTSKKERGPSRDWLALAKTTRAQSKIRAWFKRERREDSERSGREILHENLKRAGLPPQKIAGSPLLADVIREMGFRKGEDFYIALGQAKISSKTVNKLMHRLKEGESAVEAPSPAAELLERKETPKKTAASSTYGIKVEGVEDVMLRIAKCCRPVPGDPIVGYISLGKGITIHHENCPNAVALRKNPERFAKVEWEGTPPHPSASSSRWTAGTATGCSRTCPGPSPRPASTSSRRAARSCTRWSRTASSSRWGDTQSLKTAITRIRNIESVFDAYRVTPTGYADRWATTASSRAGAPRTRPPRSPRCSRRRRARGRAVVDRLDLRDRQLGQRLDLAVAHHPARLTGQESRHERRQLQHGRALQHADRDRAGVEPGRLHHSDRVPAEVGEELGVLDDHGHAAQLAPVRRSRARAAG